MHKGSKNRNKHRYVILNYNILESRNLDRVLKQVSKALTKQEGQNVCLDIDRMDGFFFLKLSL